MRKTVFVGCNQHEELEININDNQVTVDGHYWFGYGFIENKIYYGQAIYKRPIPANSRQTLDSTVNVKHQMVIGKDDIWRGDAIFGTNPVIKTQGLEWR